MEEFDSFFESLNISESSLQNLKKKQLDTKTSLYIRIIPSLRQIRIIPSLVDGLSCIYNHSRPTDRVRLG